jgi:hypothetical protein
MWETPALSLSFFTLCSMICMCGLMVTGVNGVINHNEAQEHVETSRPTGQAAWSQDKQATNNDRNPDVRHTVNLVSSTDQCSILIFLGPITSNHQLYLCFQGPVVPRCLLGFRLTTVGYKNKKFEVDRLSSLVGVSCSGFVLSYFWYPLH